MEMEIRSFTGLIDMFLQIKIAVKLSSDIICTRGLGLAYSCITDHSVTNIDFKKVKKKKKKREGKKKKKKKGTTKKKLA